MSACEGRTLGDEIARLALAEAERGVREVGGSNTGPDVRRYQSATWLPGTGWPWCAAFVTWCYEAAGVELDSPGGFVGVAALESWARAHGYWAPRVPGFEAPPGSIVIFRISHTGIVLAGGAGSDQTIEGNTSSGSTGSQRDGDGVFRRTRDHAIIKGYVVLPAILQAAPAER